MTLQPNYLVNVDEALEAKVLGSVLNEPRLTGVLLKYIKKAAVFYKPAHQCIYEAVSKLYHRADPIDLLTVSRQLTTAGANVDVAELADLTTGAYLSQVDTHCLILFQLAIKRFLGNYGAKLQQAAYSSTSDPLKLLHKINDDVDLILGNISSIAEKTANDHLRQVFADIEDKQAGRKRGITFGITALDERTGGFAPGNYVVLAAGTGQGKTGFTTHIVRHQCLIEKNSVGVVTLEMTGAEYMARLVAGETNYSNSEINRAHSINVGQAIERSSRLVDMPLYIHDKPVESIELQFIIREWVRRHGVRLVIIDYLQLVRDSRYAKAHDRVTNLSVDLKALAADLGIVILVLSQLNREFEKRRGIERRPMKSDLRETGQIEQDANAILFLFRPHLYDIQYEDNSVDKYTLELHGAKFRSADPTDRHDPWLFDYDGACNRIEKFGTMRNRANWNSLPELPQTELKNWYEPVKENAF